MRQSASNHSLIPVRANTSEINTTPPRQQKKVDALINHSNKGNNPSKLPTSLHYNTRPMIMASPEPPKRGLGISVSSPSPPPSRVPVRASPDRMKSVFASATMVTINAPEKTEGSQNSTMTREVARAQNPWSKLSEPFRTPLLGSKEGEAETPSPTYSTSISPSFIVRNLDEDPHTGLTPTVQTFNRRKAAAEAPARISVVKQLPSPPSSPESRPEVRSRLPRRSKDDLSLTESSKKLQQAAIAATLRPRRISIPSPVNIKDIRPLENDMTVALAPPAPISIPPNDFSKPHIEKPLPSAKSPGAFASLFKWGGANMPEPTPITDRLHTPSTLSHPTTPRTPMSPSVAALEQELRSVSTDLACSIRREMDLEDVITRLQEEVVRLGGEINRNNRFRTSDYFSEQSFETDEQDRKGGTHSRVSSVALEDIRMANERVTQLEKEVLQLKHDNLELMTARREAERKLKEQRRDSRKAQEMEDTITQLREELIDRTRMIDSLQQTIERNNNTINDRSRVDKSKHEEEVKALTERAKGAESQREALQLALRQLRERQALEAKKASEKIKQLEAIREKNSRSLPQTPERQVTGITNRTPDRARGNTGKVLEEKISMLQSELSKARNEVSTYTVLNTQLTNENEQLRDLQERLQARLSLIEAGASASTISEASARASLTHAHRLAVEMARITDIHIKSIEKVRDTANTTLPHVKNGKPLSPMLQSAYDVAFNTPKQMYLQQETTVKMMEARIKELEGALSQSSEEMGEVVKKMQLAQIEMIELAGERDEALRRERKLLNSDAAKNNETNVVDNSGIPA